MNYLTIRDRHVTILQGVSGTGTVLNREPYAKDWKEYIALYESDHPTITDAKVARLTYVTKVVAPEDMGEGDEFLSEALEKTKVRIPEVWLIGHIMSFYFGTGDGSGSDDDNEAASEPVFHQTIEAIQEAYRWLDGLGIPSTVHYSSPLRLTSSGLIQLGNSMVHRAEMLIDIEQHDITP